MRSWADAGDGEVYGSGVDDGDNTDGGSFGWSSGRRGAVGVLEACSGVA
jgi:hypothetical protein